MVFIFFAFAALVIDFGMVRTTQGTMTSACDTGALEALRWRDQLPPGGTTSESLDENRRVAAAALVGLEFDNNDPVTTRDGNFALNSENVLVNAPCSILLVHEV